jgi:hypothetical protein
MHGPGQFHSRPTAIPQGSRAPHSPVALLAGLSVRSNHEHRGLGAALLKDVFDQFVGTLRRYRVPGSARACRISRGRDLYLHLVPEFEPAPTDSLCLVLLMEDTRRTLRRYDPSALPPRSRSWRFRPIPLLEERAYAVSSLHPVVDLAGAIARTTRSPANRAARSPPPQSRSGGKTVHLAPHPGYPKGYEQLS